MEEEEARSPEKIEFRINWRDDLKIQWFHGFLGEFHDQKVGFWEFKLIDKERESWKSSQKL